MKQIPASSKQDTVPVNHSGLQPTTGEALQRGTLRSQPVITNL